MKWLRADISYVCFLVKGWEIGVRRAVSLILVVVFCLCGCGGEKAAVEDGGKRIDSCEGMIEYLQRQSPPALKSVGVWENEYGPGLKLTTEHYEVYTTLLEPLMLSQVPGFMESAYRGYNRQLPGPIETRRRFTIYLFAEREQWEGFTRAFAGEQAEIFCRIRAGAYYYNGACVAYNIGRERTFSALGHEGWHQFNKRHFEFRLPSWVDEGIAMLFEVSEERGGMFYFEPERNMYRLGSLKKALAGNRMMPVRELIATNPGEVLAGNEAEAVTGFYSQSYALVRFLREEGYGKRLGSFQRLLLDGLEGDWPLDEASKRIAADRNIPLTVGWNRAVGTGLFEYYIGGDIESIEGEYVTYCRKIVYHVRVR
jgi:hypothetical protein